MDSGLNTPRTVGFRGTSYKRAELGSIPRGSIEVITKKCTKCKKELDLSEYHKNRHTKDGLVLQCKKCVKAKRKRWWAKYRDREIVDKYRRFTTQKCLAKKRNKEWTITENEYIKLVSQNCFYCDASLEKATAVALDRLDNKKGYILNNVVPCCGSCNKGRGDSFTVEEWKVAAKAIKEYRKTNI